jgi:hypothetical protein
MLGSFEDLCFIEKGKPLISSKYGYMLLANKLYRIEGNKLDEIIFGIKDCTLYSNKTLNEDIGLEMEFPLYVGQRMGEYYEILRPDGMYCQRVCSSRPITLEDGGKENIYSIVYASLPDRSEKEFRPYMGYLGFVYHHNGSVSDVDVRLAKTNVGK